MQTMTVPAGEAIFRAGDPSLAVFIVQEGEVAIAVGDSPTSIEVARLGPALCSASQGVGMPPAIGHRHRRRRHDAAGHRGGDIFPGLRHGQRTRFVAGQAAVLALALHQPACGEAGRPVPAPPEAAIRVYPDIGD